MNNRNSEAPRGSPVQRSAFNVPRSESALVIFAKAPIPGEVKTRLCPPLTPDEAATLHGSFVLDVLEQTKLAVTKARLPVDRYLAFLSRNGRNMGGVDSSDMARQLKLGDVPSTAPAFTDLGVDAEGNLWVVTDPGEDTLHTSFDVFDAGGRYLGPVRAPAQLGIEAGYATWAGDALYVIGVTETGVPTVRRFRIVLGKAGG
ncbi:MAG: hypothetical protein E8D45_10495 [Nitrospira sp.]|nr:MAG: hypothetical protein E8D45_10495 [Nitrospira sp.]